MVRKRKTVSVRDIYDRITVPPVLPLEDSSHDYKTKKVSDVKHLLAKGHSLDDAFYMVTGKRWDGGKKRGAVSKTTASTVALVLACVSGLTIGTAISGVPTPTEVFAVAQDDNLDSVDSITDEKNILVVGLDTRPEKDQGGGSHNDVPGNRTDAIMVVKYSPESKDKVTVVSIPRDTGVVAQRCNDTSGDYSDQQYWGETVKINSIYDDYGVECLADVAGDIVGENIDSTIEVNFESFVSLIDSLGGITIATTGPVIDDTLGKIIPTKGTHHIDGKTALDYSRARKVKGTSKSDFDRVKRQQKVIQATMDAAAQSSQIGKLSAARALITKVLPDTSIHGLTTLDILGMAKMIPELNKDAIVSHTVPITGESADGNLIYDEDEARSLFQTPQAVTQGGNHGE